MQVEYGFPHYDELRRVLRELEERESGGKVWKSAKRKEVGELNLLSYTYCIFGG